MGPHAIDDRLCEEVVIGGRHPIGQGDSPIRNLFEVRIGCPQCTGGNDNSGPGVLQISPAAGQQYFPLVRDILATHACEKSGQAVVIVLAPLLERVVMALGTFNPHPEEELTDRPA